MDIGHAKVLIAERKGKEETSFKSVLEQIGVRVHECSDGIDVIRNCAGENPHLIVLDADIALVNGYICTRVLKGGAFNIQAPIILIGPADKPVEKYKGLSSGADYFFGAPVDPAKFEEAVSSLLSGGRSSASHASVLSNMAHNLDDIAIMALVDSALEQKLLLAEMINEINLIDDSLITRQDLIMAAMGSIGALFDYNLGTVLLMHDGSGDIYFCGNGQIDQSRLDSVRDFILNHLRQECQAYLKPNQVTQHFLNIATLRQYEEEEEDIYIHVGKGNGIRTILAFDGIGFENMGRGEQEDLLIVLDAVIGSLEKKQVFDLSQKMSLIDTTAPDNSLAFFMDCLAEEIENANRSEMPMVLFTIKISNLDEIIENLNAEQIDMIARFLRRTIFNVTNKSDLVARLDAASFAFLVTHANMDQAKATHERIAKYLKGRLSRFIRSSLELKIEGGITAFQPDRHASPESFLSDALPKNDTSGNSANVKESAEDMSLAPEGSKTG